MARIIKLVDAGNELTFEIRKMSASQGEEWMMKAFQLLGSNLGEINGKADVKAFVNLICKMPFAQTKELLNEILECCYKIDGKLKTQVTMDTVDGFISRPATLVKLRVEAIKENADFFTDILDLITQELANTKPTAQKSKD